MAAAALVDTRFALPVPGPAALSRQTGPPRALGVTVTLDSLRNRMYNLFTSNKTSTGDK